MDATDQAPIAQADPGKQSVAPKTVTLPAGSTPPMQEQRADPRISTTTGPEREAGDEPEVKVPPVPLAAEPKVLAKADGLTLVAKAEKDGKIRLQCSSFDPSAGAPVVLPGQVGELRWVEGKVQVAIRRAP